MSVGATWLRAHVSSSEGCDPYTYGNRSPPSRFLLRSCDTPYSVVYAPAQVVSWLRLLSAMLNRLEASTLLPRAQIYLLRSSLRLCQLEDSPTSDSVESSIRDLHEKISVCTLCRLSQTRHKPVPGEGPANAKVILIGEGPGRQEDLEGRPFIGRAGQFLDECLRSIGLQREQIFVTNIVKCRPTEKARNWVKDRKPATDEIDACKPYLDKQIELLKPEVICTLGDTARSQIFKRFGLEEDTIGHVHGRLFLAGSMRIAPLYHPAAALYDNSLRQIIMIDFQNLRQVLSQSKLTNF